MRKIKTRFLIVGLLFLLFLFKFNCFAAEKIYLENVIFLQDPENRLIFEFNNKPKYEVSKDENKLKLTFYNVVPKSSSWMRNLPKEVFREINVSYEKDKLYLEFSLTKPFYFQLSPFANKIIVNLLWEKPEKPVKVVIKKDKIDYLEKKPLSEIQSSLPEGTKFPEYEVYLGDHRMKMPLISKNYKGIPVTVDFQEADIHAVLRFLADYL